MHNQTEEHNLLNEIGKNLPKRISLLNARRETFLNYHWFGTIIIAIT